MKHKLRVLLLLVFVLGIQARTASADTNLYFATKAEAYSNCAAGGPYNHYNCVDTAATVVYNGTTYIGTFEAHNLGGEWVENWYAAACVAPATWDATAHSCVTSDPPSTPEQCQALASDAQYTGTAARTYSYPTAQGATQCIGGCSFGPEGAMVTSVSGATSFSTANWKFSGTTCTPPPNSPPAPPKETKLAAKAPPQSCVAAGAGQSYCVKANGDQCYTVSGTTRQICWAPGASGMQRDGAVAQVRAPGTATPPAPTVDGSTTTPVGTPTTISTTSNNTVITNTTQNFTTGTTAPADQGTPTPSDSASGGTCATNYVCAGDSLKCAMLEEQRKTRCASEAGLAGISGGDTCVTPPVCSGAKCNADSYALVLQQWKTRCATEALSGTEAVPTTGGDGESGGTGTPESRGQFGEHNKEFTANTDGMGYSRSCPVIPAISFNGGTFQPDLSKLCLGGELESVLFLIIVGLWCARHISGAT